MLDKVRVGFRFRVRRLDTVRRLLWLPLAGAALVALLLCSAQAATPVIYCTDLFHPHDDPDDHFDLITLFSLPELEVKALLLDQGRKQLEQPGSVPVKQVFNLFNKSVPVAIGLANKL